MDDLPVHTLIGDENRCGSLLLCGLNHGYSKEDERLDNSGVDRTDEYKSFFSDKLVNNYPFRNTIVNWFSLWGYELTSERKSAGPLEKSIVQTNWLQTCSNNMNGINKRQALIEDSESFMKTCEKLQPRLLFFFSQDLLWAFMSSELSEKVESIFGKRVGGPVCKQNNVFKNGKKRTRFKFYFQTYEKLEIVAMPHATGAQGVAHDYIQSFSPEMRHIIESWWKAHEQWLENTCSITPLFLK